MEKRLHLDIYPTRAMLGALDRWRAARDDGLSLTRAEAARRLLGDALKAHGYPTTGHVPVESKAAAAKRKAKS